MCKLTEASRWHAVTAIVIVALISGSSAKVPYCDRLTCPPGPVYVYFEYENCTNAMTYSMDNTVFGECKNGPRYSSISQIHSAYVETLEYFGLDCGGGQADAVVTGGSRTYFGACIPNRMLQKSEQIQYYYPAYMLLANVNDSFVSPQNRLADLNVPAYPEVLHSPCESEADCKSKGFFYGQIYANETCPAADASFDVNDVVKPFKCYRDGNSGQYLALGCYAPHTLEINRYNDNACTQLVSTSFDGNKCGTTGTETTYHCTAIKPITPTTSAASTFNPVIMLSVVMAALFTLF